MGAENSQVLSLIQKKLHEKDQVIQEQMEQITQLEESVAALQKRVSELEAANSEYLNLKAQLQSLLGE